MKKSIKCPRRSFLRLEHLFNIADHHLPQDSQWDSRIAISCLLEILDLITRSDLKSDLIKELEKHTITLDVLKNNPNVDHQRLNDILGNINDYLNTLRNSYSPQAEKHVLTGKVI